MADETNTENSNVKTTVEGVSLAASAGSVGISSGSGEAIAVGSAIQDVATAALSQATADINPPVTISVTQLRKATDLLQEQIDDIVEPPSDRTAAFKELLFLLKNAATTVEITGKIQVIAVTSSGMAVRQLSRLEQIRVDTEKASERLAVQAVSDQDSRGSSRS